MFKLMKWEVGFFYEFSSGKTLTIAFAGIPGGQTLLCCGHASRNKIFSLQFPMSEDGLHVLMVYSCIT